MLRNATRQSAGVSSARSPCLLTPHEFPTILDHHLADIAGRRGSEVQYRCRGCEAGIELSGRRTVPNDLCALADVTGLASSQSSADATPASRED